MRLCWQDLLRQMDSQGTGCERDVRGMWEGCESGRGGESGEVRRFLCQFRRFTAPVSHGLWCFLEEDFRVFQQDELIAFHLSFILRESWTKRERERDMEGEHLEPIWSSPNEAADRVGSYCSGCSLPPPHADYLLLSLSSADRASFTWWHLPSAYTVHPSLSLSLPLSLSVPHI